MNENIKQKIQKLPDSPGIYLYYDKYHELIYVGKATSLRDRVRSYFFGLKNPRPIEEMLHEVVKIGHIKTDSVLDAIILEAAYIKKLQPKYNVIGKDNKSWNYLAITREEYPRPVAIREHELAQLTTAEKKKQFEEVFGPFPGLNTVAALKTMRRLFGFCTCKPGQKSCLYYQMGQCQGVFKKEISPRDYRIKVIRPLIIFLRGEKKKLLRELNLRMNKYSKQENFEEARKLRDQILHLQKIQDIALINSSFFHQVQKNSFENIRIEGYDISNLGASEKVGSMVVFYNGFPEKHNYRKFNIKTVTGQSDVHCLVEVLERRFKHLEWKNPDLILVDGGKPQVNAAKKVLKGFGLRIPVVGIAKGPERKRNDFILGSENRSLIIYVSENQNILVKVRDEAHRFAIGHQRSRRRIVR